MYGLNWMGPHPYLLLCSPAVQVFATPHPVRSACRAYIAAQVSASVAFLISLPQLAAALGSAPGALRVQDVSALHGCRKLDLSFSYNHPPN